jgi:hypothetical protein
MSRKNERRQPEEQGGKRPYRPPVLTVHGTLQDVTKATMKGGSNQDGGKPSSRAGGPPS